MGQWNPGLSIVELETTQRGTQTGHATGASTPQTDAGDSEAEGTEEEATRRNENRTAAEIAARIEVSITARRDETPKAGRRRNTSTAQMNKAGMIACVDDHNSEHTILVQSGMGRRTYRCGHCKRRFMQQDPGTLTCIQDRDAKWVQTRPPTLPDGGERTARNPSAARAGDQLFGFHNSSGITVTQTRKQYVRKMVPGMTIFAAVETGLHGVTESDAIEEAERETGIHATVVTGGYVGAKSGIAIYIPKADAIPAETIRKRDTGEPDLQILIVDMQLNGKDTRVVVTHGEPSGKSRSKIEFLKGVQRAVREVKKQDREAGKVSSRLHMWMGDHNMVLDPERDQAEGQPINAGQAEITRIATEIEDELGVTDAFRHMHPTRRHTREALGE